MSVKTEAWDFFKKNFAVLAIAATFLILWGQGCIGNKDAPPTITIVRDSSTVQKPQPIIIVPPYQPQQPNVSYPVVIPSQYNPSNDIAKLTEQYKRLLDSYLTVKTYKDSIPLKDSAGKRVGVVDLTQIVSENELKSTQPTYQLSFPHTTIKETITIREGYKPRNQVFIGGGIEAPIDELGLNDFDIGILLKNKRDNILGLSGTYSISMSQPGIRLSYYKIIRLKKR